MEKLCKSCKHECFEICKADWDDLTFDDLFPKIIVGCKCYKKVEPKKIYGEFENVKLTDDELEKLYAKYGKSYVNSYIEKLSRYIADKHKKYKSHYRTIMNWIERDTEKKSNSQNNNGIEITYENIEQLKEKYPEMDWEEYEEEDFKPRFMGGKLGRDVVLLSPVQEDLFLHITDDAEIFNYYIELLADFIIKKKPKLKSHFNILVKWYKDNFRGFD